MPAAAILLVEDEPRIGTLVRAYLERDGFAVVWARSGAEALRRLAADGVDLAVLDLGLPDMDGLAVARRVTPGIPVVILTARSDEPERMAGFAARADDYVAKPFSPREVVARVRAVLRRAQPRRAAAEPLRVGPVVLRPAGHEVTVQGRRIELTAKEFELLWVLLEHAGQVLTRDALLERVWGYATPGQSRTVDQHVAQLRRKLGAPGLIRTVRGVGYQARRP